MAIEEKLFGSPAASLKLQIFGKHGVCGGFKDYCF